MTTKTTLNKLLKESTELLDLSPSQYEEAEKHYNAVGTFLGNCPNIGQYSPEIFPQGSFRLGTMIRPIGDDDEYDVDLVCQLDASHNDFTQHQLKDLIGDRLKEPQYINQLQIPENRRCWRLNYAEGTKFHLDIIPVIPDTNSRTKLLQLGVSSEYASEAISMTDNLHDNYDSYTTDWPKSNPKGYSEWFKNQMKIQLNEIKRMFSAQENVSIDDIPFYRVKTPLQRAVQILKRHRDTLFGNDEDKPISIIITTLSAHAYGNEDNIFDALGAILDNMINYITVDINGNDEIKNPVDGRENFADKWVQYPQRRDNFYIWLDRAKMDIESLVDKANVDLIREGFMDIVGESTANKLFNQSSTTLVPLNNQSLTLKNPSAVDYSPYEEFIEDQHSINLKNKLTIQCLVDQSGWRFKQRLEDLPILMHGASLNFSIKNHNVFGAYSVKWKVRNCGPKAKSHGVRGQILPDDGSESRSETSSFYGKHYVECYLIKDNVCVARDKIDVPIAGQWQNSRLLSS
ncbi:MAG: nucleotidyltransferase [Patiriisocius sp.]|uniref:nucleotidyltransferase n=1 Tax=Patiriisocius sp. TaxID=2822396 RepID=UPI003EF1CD76